MDAKRGWILTKSQRQKLFNGFNRLLRSALSINLSSHKPLNQSTSVLKFPDLLVTRIVQFNHRVISSGPPQVAQSVLRWNPKLKCLRSAGRQSYKNLLYDITSAKGSIPLTKLTPDSRSQHVGHLLSNCKNKSFVTARIKTISNLEQLQRAGGGGGLNYPSRWEGVASEAQRPTASRALGTQRTRHQRHHTQNPTSNPIQILADAWKSRESLIYTHFISISLYSSGCLHHKNSI